MTKKYSVMRSTGKGLELQKIFNTSEEAEDYISDRIVRNEPSDLLYFCTDWNEEDK